MMFKKNFTEELGMYVEKGHVISWKQKGSREGKLCKTWKITCRRTRNCFMLKQKKQADSVKCVWDPYCFWSVVLKNFYFLVSSTITWRKKWNCWKVHVGNVCFMSVVLGFVFNMTNMETSTNFTCLCSDQCQAWFLHVKFLKMVLIELHKVAGNMLGFENQSPFLNFTLIYVTAGEELK